MNLTYMLDTDTCIYLMNKRSPKVIENIKSHRDSGICISSITLAELEYGASKSLYYERNIIAIQKVLSIIAVLPFDEIAASYYGKIRADLEQSGLIIGPLDMLIAGHAKSQGLILITNNTGEFARIGGLLQESWV